MNALTRDSAGMDSLAQRLADLACEVGHAEGLIDRLCADLTDAHRRLEQARDRLAVQDAVIARLRQRTARQHRALTRTPQRRIGVQQP